MVSDLLFLKSPISLELLGDSLCSSPANGLKHHKSRKTYALLLTLFLPWHMVCVYSTSGPSMFILCYPDILSTLLNENMKRE